MTPLLSVENLKVEFDLNGGKVKAVDGVSFRVMPGRTTALVGESGSGKSVTAQAILRILPASATIASGRILFEDPDSKTTSDIAALDPAGVAMRAIRGGRISMIFQEPMSSLSPLHTIGSQVLEALFLHRPVDQAEGAEICRAILKAVGFPDPERAMRTYPFELSGGLRQRAMIAMALVCRPALLIADEPTTALDVTIQAQILKLIKDLQAELGMALLIITHDLGVVANMADEITVMHRGQVMEQGTLEDIFLRAEHPYLKALLGAVPRFNLPPGTRLVPLRPVDVEAGPMLKEREPWPEGADKRAPILEVEGLCKSFKIRSGSWFGSASTREVVAVDDVSFTVARGECLGLVGESSCGKTTLSKLILRAISADRGAIHFNDRGKRLDVRTLPNSELKAYRRRVQFIFQDPYGSLSPRMTVFDIVSEPLVIHGVGDDASRRALVQELMRLVGLDPRFLNRYPHSFSGGQRQRIGIARALALKPDMLICDEPVSALDVSIQAQILNLLKSLQEQLGLTYLFISHNLAVVNYVAARIAVMCAGRLVELAPASRLFRNPVHPYTRALLAAVPEPRLDARLDLTALMEGRASDPSLWPAPFTVKPGRILRLVEVEHGHFVRADANAGDLKEVA